MEGECELGGDESLFFHQGNSFVEENSGLLCEVPGLGLTGRLWLTVGKTILINQGVQDGGVVGRARVAPWHRAALRRGWSPVRGHLGEPRLVPRQKGLTTPPGAGTSAPRYGIEAPSETTNQAKSKGTAQACDSLLWSLVCM